jgi:hypothetical protein
MIVGDLPQRQIAPDREAMESTQLATNYYDEAPA